MRTFLPRLIVGSLLTAIALGSLATGAAAASNPLKCQRTIAKESSKFIETKVRALQKCADQIIKDKRFDSGPGTRLSICLNDAATRNKIDGARARLRAKIDSACGGDNRVCDGGPGEPAVQGDLGFPATCPNFESSANPSCGLALDDCGTVATCLECIHDRAIDQAISLYYDDLIDVDPSAEPALNACQVAIGKETAKFLLVKEKELRKCWDKRFKGQHVDDCPDGTALPGSASAKAAAKIVRAESKKIARICRACGGDGRACKTDVGPVAGDGVSDDLATSAIGFKTTCNHVVVPAPAGIGATPRACAASVGTLEDLVRCVDCVTDFKVDCMEHAQVPQFGGLYPAECNPPSTPTPTPTTTVTPTPTPIVTPTGPTPVRTAVPCQDVNDNGASATPFQCDGVCPSGWVCVSIDLDCRCDPVSNWQPCGDPSSPPAPFCWGDCPDPNAPVCRDFNGICACSPY